MSIIRYKFNSGREFDVIQFDGVHITLGDLKHAIVEKNALVNRKGGKIDLLVENHVTKEKYQDETQLIPMNTSVVVKRIPKGGGGSALFAKPPQPLTHQPAPVPVAISTSGQPVGVLLPNNPAPSLLTPSNAISNVQKEAVSNHETSEEDKIRAFGLRTTREYDPSNYKSSRDLKGPPPNHYTCHRCGKSGHWKRQCPTYDDPDFQEKRKVPRTTGIPRSFLVTVSNDHPGAMLTATGEYVLPAIDALAYVEGKPKPKPVESKPADEQKPPLPPDLTCRLCHDLMRDAVVVPCCGTDFCDECIRSRLLSTDDHVCPHCGSQGVSPDSLNPIEKIREKIREYKINTAYTDKTTTNAASAPLLAAFPLMAGGVPQIRGPVPLMEISGEHSPPNESVHSPAVNPVDVDSHPPTKAPESPRPTGLSPTEESLLTSPISREPPENKWGGVPAQLSYLAQYQYQDQYHNYPGFMGGNFYPYPAPYSLSEEEFYQLKSQMRDDGFGPSDLLREFSTFLERKGRRSPRRRSRSRSRSPYRPSRRYRSRSRKPRYERERRDHLSRSPLRNRRSTNLVYVKR